MPPCFRWSAIPGAVLLFCLFIDVSAHAQNLAPYRPSGWSDRIVVSSTTGSNLDSSPLRSTDTLFVDFAVINNGNIATANSYQIRLLVDGAVRGTWTSQPPLDPAFYNFLEDVSIGSLAAGTHTITVLADAQNTIVETSETDNEYTKTITVVSSLPNLAPYRPSGWSDAIVVSTITGTTIDSLSLTTTDTLYVDRAVINSGLAPAAASFQIKLYVDGVERLTSTIAPPLEPSFYVYQQDISIGSLTAGVHTIRVVADPTNAVAESNEADNEYTKVITVLSPPNLTTFKPQGWSAPIVVSTQTGTNTDSATFTTNDFLYLDFAVLNNGASPVTASFQVKLYVDGVERASLPALPPVNPNFYVYWQDYSVGRLAAGTHTLRIVADLQNAVAESNEADNEYTRTITVNAATSCFTLLTNVTPSGSGTITRSQNPNCGAGLTLSDLVSEGEPAINVMPSTLGRSFEDLISEAQIKGSVRVIVGLRSFARTQKPLTDEALQSQHVEIAQAQANLLAHLESYNVRWLHRFKYVPYLALEVDASALRSIRSLPEVLSVHEEPIFKPALLESTQLIGAPFAWNIGFSGAGQTVAIVDDGVDKTHSFLAGKVVSEACFSSGTLSLCPGGVSSSTAPDSGRPCPGCSHGTHVAGIAAGKGSTFSGVARDANIIAIQTASRNADLTLTNRGTDIVAALERVFELRNSFRIASVNVSLGGNIPFTSPCDLILPEFKDIIERLRQVGIATVIASGNDGFKAALSHPACISSAISVGSTDDGSEGTTQDAVSDFSNRSSFLKLFAPGNWIASSVPNNRYESFQGTSMAAPHVTGAWAVMKSKFPTASVDQVLSALTNTGHLIVDSQAGVIKPRIRLDAALQSLTSGESYSSGSTISLTASPRPGYQFRSWSGCDSVSGNTCAVTMNNARNVTATFDPVATSPDLLTTSVSGPSSAVAGGPITLSASVQNQGAVNASAFRIGVYLSADTNIASSDILIAYCDYTSGLAAGSSSTCSGVVTLSSVLNPGPYFIGAIADYEGRVSESNETNNTRLGQSVTITAGATTALFVPIVLSAAGLNNSFFSSELTLTNIGTQTAQPQFAYSAAFGDGGGTASDYLGPGQQRIIPDAIAYLRSIGVSMPDSGNRGGTLTVRAGGLASNGDIGITVRTTTPVSGGRAGLAYGGIQTSSAFTVPTYLCGLRQNDKDRSNVAIQNAGTVAQGNITLRLTVFSGDSEGPRSTALPDETLAPGEFKQFTGILASNGLSIKNGFVRVERVSGSAPYYAYGVVNDQFNSDGSFIPPISENTMVGKRRLTLPVVVEANEFSSEVILTNWSSAKKSLLLRFVADAIQTPNTAATLLLEVNSNQQLVLPDFVEYLRTQGVAGIGPRGSAYVGAMFVEATEGDLAGVFVSARTSSPGGGGRFGLFYGSIPEGSGSTTTASILGLQQNFENRSNLAIVNTGEVDGTSSTFRIELFNGATGIKVNTIDGISVKAGGWKQLGAFLAEFAPGVSQGYAFITRMSGNNPFIAYGVINDGATSGERTGDGAFVPSFP